MRILNAVGNAALWLLAALGVASLLVWGAGRAGLIQPLVVVSGSMEPGIMTGDLLVDVRVPTEQVEVGDVVSLRSPLSENLVTHRVVAVERTGESTWGVRLKGDANDVEDGGVYEVGDHVWQPAVQLSGGGNVVASLSRPSVVVPLGVTLLALVGLVLMPSDPPRRRPEEPSAPAEPAEHPTTAREGVPAP
jgi:signal peptidase